MVRLELGLQFFAHGLIGLEIIALPRKKPADCDLVILVRLDRQLAPVMAIGNQGLVQLLNRERQSEILGMTMPDVADEAMKYSV